MSSGPAGCIMASPFQCMDAQEPVRATYVNPYGWPESDAEFVRSVSSGEHRRRRPHRHGQYHPHPGVVDSYSCRQIYLRSYTFSRKETVHERTRRYLGRVKGKVTVAVTGKGMLACLLCRGGCGGGGSVGMAAVGGRFGKKRKKRCIVIRRLREVSAAALRSLFRRLLSCTAAVDVTGREPF